MHKVRERETVILFGGLAVYGVDEVAVGFGRLKYLGITKQLSVGELNKGSRYHL
jgi:hypothetical protein